MITEKLQKVLARAGVGSRRQLEDWIRQGRVYVNHQRAQLGDRVQLNDKIQVDGRIIKINPKYPPKQQVLCYHKVAGEMCTRHDPEGRPTVFEHLPPLKAGRWISVGRLDLNTSGLLLMTTEGELAHRLMHPSYQIEREYAVRILGEVTAEMLERLKTGVLLEDGPARFQKLLEVGGTGANRWYHVVVTEGRHREVRELWESQGVVVSRLIRVRFGPISLPRNLRAGQYQFLQKEEANLLLQQVGVKTLSNVWKHE